MSDGRFFHLDFSQLSYFIAAAKHLNFSKAAAECHVVPNVISKQISKLETILNTPMFDRVGKRVYLTEAGKIFYKCALDISERLASSVQEMKEYDPSLNMRIEIGYYDTWSETVISPIVRDFKAKYPDAAITIKYINLPQILPRLNNGFLDAAILTSFKKVTNPTIDSFILKRSPMNLVVSKADPLSEKEEVGLDELQNENFANITVPQSSIDNLKKSLFFEDDITMYIDKYNALGLEQSQNIHNIYINIKSGMNFGFLPEACKDYTENIGVKFIKIKEKLPSTSMHVIWSKNNTNPALPLFVDVARNHINLGE